MEPKSTIIWGESKPKEGINGDKKLFFAGCSTMQKKGQ